MNMTMAMVIQNDDGNGNDNDGNDCDGNLWAFLADECPILVVPHSPTRHNSTEADCNDFDVENCKLQILTASWNIKMEKFAKKTCAYESWKQTDGFLAGPQFHMQSRIDKLAHINI